MTNSSDAALLVGGVYLENGEWVKFSNIVKGNGISEAGLFVDDFEIHFVERP